MKNGFTLIELIVVIAIIAVLSGVILFSITWYINKGKDSNVSANLAVLIPAGEVYYNANDSYEGFCGSSVVDNAILQMPVNEASSCYTANPAGICCSVGCGGNCWAACAIRFLDPNSAYCVDSRGVRKEISAEYCQGAITECD